MGHGRSLEPASLSGPFFSTLLSSLWVAVWRELASGLHPLQRCPIGDWSLSKDLEESPPRVARLRSASPGSLSGRLRGPHPGTPLTSPGLAWTRGKGLRNPGHGWGSRRQESPLPSLSLCCVNYCPSLLLLLSQPFLAHAYWSVWPVFSDGCLPSHPPARPFAKQILTLCCSTR